MTWDSTIDGCPYCKAPPGAPHALGCIGSPYDGATGVVPRLNPTPPVRYSRDTAAPNDPVQQAVDDYLLMERKARAWDELRRQYAPLIGMVHAPEVVACMDALVHPAPTSSTR